MPAATPLLSAARKEKRTFSLYQTGHTVLHADSSPGNRAAGSRLQCTKYLLQTTSAEAEMVSMQTSGIRRKGRRSPFCRSTDQKEGEEMWVLAWGGVLSAADSVDGSMLG